MRLSTGAEEKLWRATAAAAGTPAPAAAAKTGSGAAVKIILILVGVLFVAGVMAVGGLVYVGYRAKQKITQIASDYGLDSGSVARSSVPSTPPTGNGCPFLPWQDASRILSVAFQRVESTRDAKGSELCEFFVTPEERKRVGQRQVSAAIGQINRAAEANNEKAGMQASERLTTGAFNVFQSLVAGANNDAVLHIEVVRQGGQSMWSRIESVQGGVQNVSGLGMQPIEGVGDKAYLLPGGVNISALKGDTCFTVVFGFAPGPDKAAEVARQVAGHL